MVIRNTITAALLFYCLMQNENLFRMENFQGSYQNGAGGGGDVGQMSTDFQRLSQTVGSNVQKILQNVSSMQRMIANIGTPQDNQQLQTQLHQIQHYTRQLAQDTSKHIKQLNEYGDQANVATLVSASEIRQWRLQRERLTNDFTKALNSFQAAQRAAAQKEKDVVKKAKHSGSSGLAGPTNGGNPLIDMEQGNQNTTATVMRQQVIVYNDYFHPPIHTGMNVKFKSFRKTRRKRDSIFKQYFL